MKLTYQQRLRLYEEGKRKIASTHPTPSQYEARVTALARRLGI